MATTERRLISIRHDGTKVVNLMNASKYGAKWVSQFQDRVVDWLSDDSEHILMAADMEETNLPNVYRINVNTGMRSTIKVNRQGVMSWIADQKHRVRLGIKFKDKDFTVVYCQPDEKDWKTAWKYTAFSNKQIVPMGF